MAIYKKPYGQEGLKEKAIKIFIYENFWKIYFRFILAYMGFILVSSLPFLIFLIIK